MIKLKQVHTEIYRGWRIYITHNTDYSSHAFEWKIRRGKVTHRDPTSASNMDSSIIWAKQAVDRVWTEDQFT
jgi:hypothetical protein